jgi:hypothetical protein
MTCLYAVSSAAAVGHVLLDHVVAERETKQIRSSGTFVCALVHGCWGSGPDCRCERGCAEQGQADKASSQCLIQRYELDKSTKQLPVAIVTGANS